MSEPTTVPWSRSIGVVGAVMGFRLFLLFVASVSEHWVPLQFNMASAEVNGRVIETVDLTTQLSNWDAHHYLTLATQGYEAGGNATAFYPLWPAVISLVNAVIGSPLASALLASNLLFAVAVLLLHRWAAQRQGSARADRFILLFVAFPGAIFYSLAYSESLFLALSAGIFLALDKKNWLWVAALAVLLSLTRAPGLFAVIPLAFAARTADDKTAWLAPTGALVGFGLHLALMMLRTGSPWTGFEAQALYINHSTPMALIDVPRFVAAMVSVDGLHSVTGSAIDRLCFAVWALALYPLWLRDRTAFWWTAALGWVSVAGVGFMAFTRYLAVLFPVFWVAAEALEPEPDQPYTMFQLMVSLGLAVQVLFLLRYLSHYWVG